MKKFYVMTILGSLFFAINAKSSELAFPKDVACGPSDYTGRVAWIIEVNGERVVVLKRPYGNYLCDLSTENTGNVVCSAIDEPLGSMPEKINVTYSETKEQWEVFIASFYRYGCDKN
jgi:hypothetical protein